MVLLARTPSSEPFAQGPHQFPDNPSLSAFARDIHESLAPDNEAFGHVPAADNRFALGAEDRRYQTGWFHSVSINDTSTLSGRMEVARGGILDFATNSSLVVIPVYTGGTSPFDLWHPASPWLRQGAIWLQES